MRIRMMNILWAAGGYLIGSGKAKQLWAKGKQMLEERQRQGATTGPASVAGPPPDVASVPRTPYDTAAGLGATPVESYTA